MAEALAGEQVVVDVANSPSFEDKAVLEFFETSGRNLLAAEVAAGVGHHVALSVVGTDRLLGSGSRLAQPLHNSGVSHQAWSNGRIIELTAATLGLREEPGELLRETILRRGTEVCS